MTEKINIKVFLGDSQTPEDFSFSQLSTKSGSLLPVISNDIYFSSVQNIPFNLTETEEERIKVLTNESFFSQNIKASPRETKVDEIRKTFNNNIITVLFFLFPTFYNSIPNIHNSFDDKVPHSGVDNIIAPVLKKNKKVSTPADGIVYYKGNTVLQLTWKNDVFNVPEFQQLFSEIYSFYVWSKTEGMQKINAGLQKIVENIVDPKNNVGTTLTKNVIEIIKISLPQQPQPGFNNNYSSLTSTIPYDAVQEINGYLTKIEAEYKILKNNYDNRQIELVNEKRNKPPVEKIDENKKFYDEKQEIVVKKISELITNLKYYDNTYNQNTSRITPTGSIVKGTIDNFSSLIVNRSIYDVLEKNEYIFKNDDPLPKNQQTVYDYLGKYPEYTKMTEAVAKYRGFVVKTFNNELNRLCNDFFNNTNRDLLYFILHIQKNFLFSTKGKTVLENSFNNVADDISEQAKNSSNLYYVGGIIQRSNNRLLIYIGLDVIRGKVTTINQQNLKKCILGNEQLGNLFTELSETKNRALVKNYFYDVLPSMPGQTTQPQQNEVRQGGQTRKRNRQHKRRKAKQGIKKSKKTKKTNRGSVL